MAKDATYDNHHTTAKDSRSSDSADRSSQNQDPHTGCYSTDQRPELEDEDGKDDDMF